MNFFIYRDMQSLRPGKIKSSVSELQVVHNCVADYFNSFPTK
jgi:hypothetical protein